MKKLMALAVLALTVSAPAIAGDILGRGVKDAGKKAGKGVAVTAKETAKGTMHIVKFLF